MKPKRCVITMGEKLYILISRLIFFYLVISLVQNKTLWVATGRILIIMDAYALVDAYSAVIQR